MSSMGDHDQRRRVTVVVIAAAAVVLPMAFSVQKWGKLFHWREYDDDLSLESSGGAAISPSSSSPSLPSHLPFSSSPSTREKPIATPRRRLKKGTSSLGLRDITDILSLPKLKRSTQRPVISRPTPAWEFTLSPEVQETVSKNRYPGHLLPEVSQGSALSAELQHLVLGEPDASDDQPEHYVPHHRSSRQDQPRDFTSRPQGSDTVHAYVPSGPFRSRHRRNYDVFPVASYGWDRRHNSNQQQSSVVPAPLNVRKFSNNPVDYHGVYDQDTSPCSSPQQLLTYKPEVEDFRADSPDFAEIIANEEGLHSCKRRGPRASASNDPTQYRSVKRARLYQALPDPPPSPASIVSMDFQQEPPYHHRDKADSGVGSDMGHEAHKGQALPTLTTAHDGALIDDNPSHEYKTTYETTMHETMAPAVVHETIYETYHEIRQEVITREIHNHHIFHRILPVVDIEVLPARHFVSSSTDPTKYREIAASTLSPEINEKVSQAVKAAVAQLLPPSRSEPEMLQPRRFTAREFPGTEGDTREWVDEHGVSRSERWWVHAPTVEDGARKTGQTQPLYFGADMAHEAGEAPSLHDDSDTFHDTSGVPPNDSDMDALQNNLQEMRIVLDVPAQKSSQPRSSSPSADFFAKEYAGRRRPRASEVFNGPIYRSASTSPHSGKTERSHSESGVSHQIPV